MSHSFWRPSEEQRRTILLLEALALIHDMGKLSNRFLESQAPSATTEYEHTLLADPRLVHIYSGYKTIPDDAAANYVETILADAGSKPSAFQERVDLTTVLEQLAFTDWTGQQYNFAELSPLVARPGLANRPADWPGVLTKEMQPGLLIGRLHGTAHIEKEGEPDHKQHYNQVFRSTPFGLEEQIGTVFSQELSNALNALPLADIKFILTDRRSD